MLPEPLERPAERCEQPQLLEPLVAGRAQLDELGQDPLAGRTRNEFGVFSDQALRFGVEAEAELVFEADGAEEAQGIVAEGGWTDHPQNPPLEIGQSAERIDGPPADEGNRDCVDREVPRREVGLDAPDERSEVDRAPGVERNAPRAVPLRKRKGRASRTAREAPSGGLRLPDRDVQIDERPAEQLVADGAADDPCILALEHLTGELTHRQRSAAPARTSCRSRRRSRS